MGRTADLTAAQMIITDILNKQAQKEPAEKELTEAVVRAPHAQTSSGNRSIPNMKPLVNQRQH